MNLENSKLSLTHEVVENSSKAKLISQGYSAGSQYKYKANALLIGYAPLRPYDPIYLKGLRDGMSGVWVVISVTHVFNDSLKYTMRVHLGSNDVLLKIKYDKPIKDVSKTIGVHYPKILDEQDKLFTRSHKDSKKYALHSVDTKNVFSENIVSRPGTKDPVREYIKKYAPNSTGHVNPYEHTKPGNNNSNRQPKWETL